MSLLSRLQNSPFNLKKDKVTEYLYGYSYPVITAGIVLLFWLLNLQIVGISFLALWGCYIFITQRDLTPIFPLLFFAPLTFSDLGLFGTITPIFIFAPVVVAIVIHFIRFPIRKPFIGKVFFAHIIVTVALFLGGLLYDNSSYFKYGIPLILCSGVAMLAEYFVLFQYVEVSNKVNLKKYFAFCLIVTTMLAIVQFLIVGILNQFNTGQFIPDDFAWANVNFLGYFVLLSVPMCFYLMVNAKSIIPQLITLLILTLSVFIIKCDGAIGILVFTLPVLIFITYKKINLKDRKLYSAFFFSLVVMAIVAIMVMFATINDFLAILHRHFLYDTGRTYIYEIAWNLFKENPLFGVGLGYTTTTNKLQTIFHSTIFEVLGCMGIFGLIAYVWYFIKRISVFTCKYTLFNLYAFFSFFLYEGYAFIDNGEFIFLIIYLTAVVIVAEVTNVKDKKETLPLKENPSNTFKN